jgi:hypothetical protein
METLTVGDEIKWKGNFGKEPEKIVRVAGIQVNEFNGSDEGVLVNSVPWHRVKDRRVILQLANTHWCWAFQASPHYDDEDVKLTGDDEPVDRDLIPDKYQNGYWE